MASYNGATNLYVSSGDTGPFYHSYDGAVDIQTARLTESSFSSGELYGFASEGDETDMQPIAPGETNVLKKTITFMVYTDAGLPASGNPGEGAVVSPTSGELQVNKNAAGYTNYTGTFSHISDGKYRYIFHDNEVSGATEGYVLLRLKVSGFRVLTKEVPLRNSAVAAVETVGTTVDTINTTTTSISTDVSTANGTLAALALKVDDLHKIGTGRWKIQGTQLLLYDTDNTTVLYAFNLKDDNGAASSSRIFERVPTP